MSSFLVDEFHYVEKSMSLCVQSTRGKMIRHNMIRNRENEGCVFTHKNDFPKYDSHGLKQDSEEIIGCLEEEICSTTQ